MSVPTWAGNEQSIDAAKNYLRQGETVDFFEMIARSILLEHPENPVRFALDLVQMMIDGSEIPPETDFNPQKLEDNAYMQTKGVSELIDQWVIALLDAQPSSAAERMEFHRQYLQGILDAQ